MLLRRSLFFAFILVSCKTERPNKPTHGVKPNTGDVQPTSPGQTAPSPTSAPQSPSTGQTPTNPSTPSSPEPGKGNVPGAVDVTFTGLTVSNSAGAKMLKGDTLSLKIAMKNAGSGEGTIRVTPILTSKRFSDYANVRLPTQDVKVIKGDSSATINVEPFFRDEATKKEYALNRGAYSVVFEVEADGKKTIYNNLPGRDFNVERSNAVFTAVFWSQPYFDKVKYTGGVAKWLQETYTRPAEIMTPSAPNSSTGTFRAFPKGFDEMMGVRTMFRTFEGFALNKAGDFSGAGILRQVEAYAKKALGLQKDFQGLGCNGLTHIDNHGFDMAVGLDRDGFGGLAWQCGNTLASGVFDGDPSVGRSQMVLIHEVGHNYGAPHCDPIQGFVMCSGEKHERYASNGTFVWHKNSIDVMTKKDPVNVTVSLTEPFSAESVKLDLQICKGNI